MDATQSIGLLTQPGGAMVRVARHSEDTGSWLTVPADG